MALVLVWWRHRSMSGDTGRTRHEATTPDPDDDRKPDSPADLDKRSWKYVARKTWREFSDDQCTDLAAALTYYAVLAIFPAVLALPRCSGWSARPRRRSRRVLDVLDPLVSAETLRHHRTRPCAELGQLPGRRARPASSVSPARCGRPPATSAPSAGR